MFGRGWNTPDNRAGASRRLRSFHHAYGHVGIIASLQSPTRQRLPALRRLSLQESKDVVVINGRVSSYYLKQLAQEAIMPALDGRELQNQVAVVREPAMNQS